MLTRIEITEQLYSRELSLSNPKKLFVFGDNMSRSGKGGQAVIRGLPNSYGVSTKIAPRRDQDAYYSDNLPGELMTKVVEVTFGDLLHLRRLFMENWFTHIVFPVGGLGTGLAELPTRAPGIFFRLDKELQESYGIYHDKGDGYRLKFLTNKQEAVV